MNSPSLPKTCRIAGRTSIHSEIHSFEPSLHRPVHSVSPQGLRSFRKRFPDMGLAVEYESKRKEKLPLTSTALMIEYVWSGDGALISKCTVIGVQTNCIQGLEASVRSEQPTGQRMTRR
jgi:hypothetical protein